jgi:predicted histidine transporter YuiF (NhaC family)
MFTFASFVMIAAIGWSVGRENVKDRSNIAHLNDVEVRSAVLQARQDIKLVAVMLAGILVMLGIIADRLH